MPTTLAQTTLVKYTLITRLLEKGNFYAKVSNGLGLPHIGFYDRVIPSSMYREQHNECC